MSLYCQGVKLNWIDFVPGAEQVPIEDLEKLCDNLNTRALLFEGGRKERFSRNQAAYKMIAEAYAQARPDIVARARALAIGQIDDQWLRFSDEMDLSEAVAPPPVPEGQGPRPEAGGEGSPSILAALGQLRKGAGVQR